MWQVVVKKTETREFSFFKKITRVEDTWQVSATPIFTAFVNTQLSYYSLQAHAELFEIVHYALSSHSLSVL